MFDDIPTQSQSAPGNLPIPEPEDMFANTEATPSGAVHAVGEPPMPPAPAIPSAVSAGVLRPRTDGTDASSRENYTMPALDTGTETKKPILARILIACVGVVVLAGIGYGVYAFVFAPKTDESSTTQTPESTSGDALPVSDSPVMGNDTTEEAQTPSDVTNDDIQNNILFAEPIDVDGDTVDDDTERGLGTDPNMWDTDGDKLSDGEEVNIFETNPLNPDTDGDTYPDGQEVQAGYNPRGTGKLQIIPRATVSSSSSASNVLSASSSLVTPVISASSTDSNASTSTQ